MERYRVVRIEEQMYGCEELPEGAEVCCDVTVEAADGIRKTLSCPDAELTRQGIDEGDAVLGDSCNYLIGHYFGKKLFSKPDSKIFKQSHLEKTHHFFQKYGGKIQKFKLKDLSLKLCAEQGIEII